MAEQYDKRKYRVLHDIVLEAGAEIDPDGTGKTGQIAIPYHPHCVLHVDLEEAVSVKLIELIPEEELEERQNTRR